MPIDLDHVLDQIVCLPSKAALGPGALLPQVIATHRIGLAAVFQPLWEENWLPGGHHRAARFELGLSTPDVYDGSGPNRFFLAAPVVLP